VLKSLGGFSCVEGGKGSAVTSSTSSAASCVEVSFGNSAVEGEGRLLVRGSAGTSSTGSADSCVQVSKSIQLFLGGKSICERISCPFFQAPLTPALKSPKVFLFFSGYSSFYLFFLWHCSLVPLLGGTAIFIGKKLRIRVFLKAEVAVFA